MYTLYMLPIYCNRGVYYATHGLTIKYIMLYIYIYIYI